eukprot:CAMPEP_0176463356 /NCGR_PEP_ID=MMETSP0127-20121128/35832_1 /TAXON_ID=938130 /ORGANISM="Platyophrya macrostoma, Strain WH" /LENGTH=359 /DNA_ID=CAMNT_0017855485 /DNA_START=20 /DNA_END=1099 /DNA_ORIENTATION=+
MAKAKSNSTTKASTNDTKKVEPVAQTQPKPTTNGDHKKVEPKTQPESKPEAKPVTNHKAKAKSTSNTPAQEEGESFSDRLPKIIETLTYSIPPNIKTLPLSFYANFQKGSMFFFLLYLMYYFKNYSRGAFIYLAMHASYGFMWNLKTLAFPDRAHLAKMSIGSLPLLFTVLIGYWYLGYFMMSGQGIQNPSPERICIGVCIFTLGSVLMMTAQKYFTLKYKKGLIDSGMISRNRNTNYLGEMMLYGALAYMNGTEKSYVPWAILLTVWTIVFSITIFAKELSLKKKEGYQQYKEKSWLLLFKPFRSDILSLLVYAIAAAGVYYVYSEGGMTPVLKKMHPYVKKTIDGAIAAVVGILKLA